MSTLRQPDFQVYWCILAGLPTRALTLARCLLCNPQRRPSTSSRRCRSLSSKVVQFKPGPFAETSIAALAVIGVTEKVSAFPEARCVRAPASNCCRVVGAPLRSVPSRCITGPVSPGIGSCRDEEETEKRVSTDLPSKQWSSSKSLEVPSSYQDTESQPSRQS
jgi:hypothetical protein